MSRRKYNRKWSAEEKKNVAIYANLKCRFIIVKTFAILNMFLFFLYKKMHGKVEKSDVCNLRRPGRHFYNFAARNPFESKDLL